MKTGAVIAAAGLSSRMNSFKPMLQLGGSTIIKTVITTLQSAGIEEIAVVTGKEAELLEKHISSTGVTCLYNPEYASSDMFHSVSIGLNFIKSRCDRVFLLPADIPLFSMQSLFIMSGYMDCNDCDILIPTNNKKSGHPILLNCGIIPELLDFNGDNGLKEAIESFKGNKAKIELDDAGLLLDADNPDDYKKLQTYFITQTMKLPLSCSIQTGVKRKQLFFDEELCGLLQLVNQHNSLHKACEEMGLSYSKGWKLVKIAEHQLGFPLLDSQIGGNHGGGSSLTYECTHFIKQYEEFSRDVDDYAAQAFARRFKEYLHNTDEMP